MNLFRPYGKQRNQVKIHIGRDAAPAASRPRPVGGTKATHDDSTSTTLNANTPQSIPTGAHAVPNVPHTRPRADAARSPNDPGPTPSAHAMPKHPASKRMPVPEPPSPLQFAAVAGLRPAAAFPAQPPLAAAARPEPDRAHKPLVAQRTPPTTRPPRLFPSA